MKKAGVSRLFVFAERQRSSDLQHDLAARPSAFAMPVCIGYRRQRIHAIHDDLYLAGVNQFGDLSQLTGVWLHKAKCGVDTMAFGCDRIRSIHN
jgi:hypothetical protein